MRSIAFSESNNDESIETACSVKAKGFMDECLIETNWSRLFHRPVQIFT